MMQQNKTTHPVEEKEIICRKCNAVYAFLGIIFFGVLLIMLLCLLTIDLGSTGTISVVEFFFLVEVVVAIVVFEVYMDMLIIGKDGIRFESGILVKNKKEIPYDKINSINIHSVFGLGHLEVKTGNEEMTRYRFLHNYEEVEKIIKEHMHKDKK